jgi:CelD/BcsL family acetyltransferase involved in cellulose biosynthesis
MNIVEINDEQGFADLAADWTDLLDAYEAATVHSTYTWLQLWWQHYRGGRELLILAARDGDRTVGIAPLTITTSPAAKGLADLRTISFLGQGSSDYGDFIVPTRHDEICAAFVDHLLAIGKRWDRIDLREIRSDSPNLGAFQTAAAERNLECERQESTTCLQVMIASDWDEYFSRVRAKFRSDVRRRLAKLEQIGPVSLERHATCDAELWRELLQINEKHYDEKNKQDLSKNFDYLQQVTTRLGELGMLDVAVLKVGSEIAAYNIGLRYRDVISHWRVGFQPELYKFAPGRLLIRFLLEQCHTDGTKCFDFMRGDEDYKKAWAFDERANVNLSASNAQLTSKVKSVLRRTLSRRPGSA